MPTDAAQTPYRLALLFIRQNQLVVLAPLLESEKQLAKYMHRIITDGHETFAMLYRDIFVLGTAKDHVKAFWERVTNSTRSDIDRGLDMTYEHMFNKALMSILAIWFLRWKQRFAFMITTEQGALKSGDTFMELALEEVIEYMLRETVSRKRQREWFERARRRYFEQFPAAREPAQASGWYDALLDDTTIQHYIETDYVHEHPYAWMWAQLSELSSREWTPRAENREQ